MSELVADCPRCDCSKMTFDVLADNVINQEYGWMNFYESFSICRHCHRGTTFILAIKDYETRGHVVPGGPSRMKETVNDFMTIEGRVTLKDEAFAAPPDYIPKHCCPK